MTRTFFNNAGGDPYANSQTAASGIVMWVNRIGPALLIIAAFLVSRGTLFFDIPLLKFAPDWSGYFKVADSLLNGDLPGSHTLKRGLLFPSLVALLFSMGFTHFGAVVAFSILRLVAALILTYTIGRIGVVCRWIMAIAMSAYLVYPAVVHVDQFLLPDMLFESLELICAAFLCVALLSGRRVALLLASIMAGLAVLTKASSIYLLVLIGITLGLYLAIYRPSNSRWKMSATAAALFPLIILYGSLVSYNGIMNGAYTASAMGVYGWVANTFPMWQVSSQYSPKLNQIITDAQAKYFDCETDGECEFQGTKEEFITEVTGPATLLEAREPPKRGFYSVGVSFTMNEILLPYREAFVDDASSRWEAIAKSGELRKVGFDSIERYPSVYMRKVAAQAYQAYIEYRRPMSCSFSGQNGAWPYCVSEDGSGGMIERATSYKEMWEGRSWYDGNERDVVGWLCCEPIPRSILTNIGKISEGNTEELPWLNAYKTVGHGIVVPVFDRPVLLLAVWWFPMIAVAGMILKLVEPRVAAVTIVVCAAGIGVGLVTALVQSMGIRDLVAIRGFQFASIGMLGYFIVHALLGILRRTPRLN